MWPPTGPREARARWEQWAPPKPEAVKFTSVGLLREGHSDFQDVCREA